MLTSSLTMSYLELLKLASPEAVVVLTALVALSISLATKRAAATCRFVAALGVVIAIVAVLFMPGNETLFGGMLVISPLTSLFKIVCVTLAFFTILLTQAEKAPRHPGEYLALVLLATVGLMLLVESEELLMIFIGLELLGLSLYVMAAFDKTEARSAEAGLKYFLFGSTSSAFTLFGISLIYGMTGTTGLVAISTSLATTSVQPLLASLAASSIVVGTLVALAQSNVRRLLAYSAVAHAGYTLIGFVAGDRQGFSAALFYTTVYAVTLVGAFGVVGVVRRETGSDDFSNFCGLSSRSPLLAGCMAVFMLSLAGIPPLAGFFGKFYLFSAALHAGANNALLWLVALGLVGSFVSLYYYLLVLKAIFVDAPSLAAAVPMEHMRSDSLQGATVAVLAAGVVLLGVMPNILASRILAAIP